MPPPNLSSRSRSVRAAPCRQSKVDEATPATSVPPCKRPACPDRRSIHPRRRPVLHRTPPPCPALLNPGWDSLRWVSPMRQRAPRGRPRLRLLHRGLSRAALDATRPTHRQLRHRFTVLPRGRRRRRPTPLLPFLLQRREARATSHHRHHPWDSQASRLDHSLHPLARPPVDQLRRRQSFRRPALHR